MCGSTSTSTSTSASTTSSRTYGYRHDTGPVTVRYTARDSYYADETEHVTTFKDEYDYTVWRSHNALAGNYRADGQDERWAARNIEVIG